MGRAGFFTARRGRASHYSLLITHYSLLKFVHFYVPDTVCPIHGAGFFTAQRQWASHYSLLITHYSLLITHYLGRASLSSPITSTTGIKNQSFSLALKNIPPLLHCPPGAGLASSLPAMGGADFFTARSLAGTSLFTARPWRGQVSSLPAPCGANFFTARALRGRLLHCPPGAGQASSLPAPCGAGI